MRKRFCLFLLLIATACQQQKPAAHTVNAATLRAASQAAAKPALDSSSATIAPVVADEASLTPEMGAAFRQVDVSKLFLAPESQSEGFKMALDGFFGADPQRLSLAILQATRDSLRPELIHVTGKARNRKQISSFSGEIHFTQLADYFDQGFLLSQGGDEFSQDTTKEGGPVINANAYSASATFRFVGNAPATYVLTGQALLDFWVRSDGKVGMMYTPGEGMVLEKAPTKGSGLVFTGNWQEPAGKSARPFLVSLNIFLQSPDLIKDFGIGDRNSQVNSKYAKLGWSTYWENDEWWADSPKPKLSL
ncbi:hypothetical protein [Hymenobacter convexus]|uniref:hypothetical protein n=1 Tax=Hymenobacter sp. CA1UV-4 TaxID=3063782 RepID=UPI00271244CF|nr:hypothetical protein [Hymenobacter sp. CA1UV-4]MDO7851521.1 hypothetical protein [Hymenobacter sp. CA1UV-4]